LRTARLWLRPLAEAEPHVLEQIEAGTAMGWNLVPDGTDLVVGMVGLHHIDRNAATAPAAPTDTKQPGLRPGNQRRSRVRPACGAVFVRCRQLDALSPSQRVHDEIAQHVCDRPRDLGRRPQDMLVEAVGEYLPGATHQPVETACDPHRKSLQAAREPHGIGRLHDQVEVISLHGEMDQPEPSAIASFRECRRERAEAAAATKVPHVRQHAPGHVHRMVLRQKRPGHVRYAGPLRLGFPARAVPLPTPGGQPQRKLFRSFHLESA